jgi:hypothetical protein
MKKGKMVNGLGVIFFGMLMLASCGGGRVTTVNTNPNDVNSARKVIFSEEFQDEINAYNDTITNQMKDRRPTLTEIPSLVAYSYLLQYYIPLPKHTHQIINTYDSKHESIIYASASNVQSLMSTCTTARYQYIVMSVAKMTSELKTIIGNSNSYHEGQLYFVYSFASMVNGNLVQQQGTSYLACGTNRLIVCSNSDNDIVQAAIAKYLSDPQPKTDLNVHCMAGPAAKPEVTDIYYTPQELKVFLDQALAAATANDDDFNNVAIYFAENSSTTSRSRRFEFLHRGCNGTRALNEAKFFDFSSARP